MPQRVNIITFQVVTESKPVYRTETVFETSKIKLFQVRIAAKKIVLVARPLRPNPPPSSLMNLEKKKFRVSKKVIFS